MKKYKIAVGALLLAGASLTFCSCMGSFAMTKNVYSWNSQIGSKFVNELVFFLFFPLPVYPVSMVADLLIVNAIEFWSGENPMLASTKTIETESGRYLIDCDGKGYTITQEMTGQSLRLDFNEETQTWAYENEDGEAIPFMTFIDDSHVKMITPEGDCHVVELSQQGVMAYASECGFPAMAANF